MTARPLNTHPATTNGEHEVKTAAIYARVGTPRHLDDGQTSRAIERQITLCREYAHQHALDVASDAIYFDVGRRAHEWDDLVSQLARFDAVIVCSLDRLTRSPRDFASVLAMLDTFDVELHSITETLDTSTPMGRAMTSLALAFAEIESGVRR